MKNKIFLYHYSDGALARFESRLGGPEGSPWRGRRVKHYVYRDKDDPEAYVHLTHYLTTELGDGGYSGDGIVVSDRVFWGKVRLVETLTFHQARTWCMIADAVSELRKLEADDLLKRIHEEQK